MSINFYFLAEWILAWCSWTCSVDADLGATEVELAISRAFWHFTTVRIDFRR